ncbi:MAG TPA: type III pantothenate kinase [Actinomycetota bacterium]|nr:type III pantothenate kinase [Actinomycetota bacterium]
MLLAVDVGNTQTHIGIFSGDEIVAQWRTSTEPRRTDDELALVFRDFLSLADLSFSRQVTGVVIASVVPTLTGALKEMVERYFHFDPVVIEPGTKTGMPILTDNPREVGADRIANAVAAFDIAGGPVIAIDFGTATNFDVVSEGGDYLGGAIAPGVMVSAGALWNSAAKIQKVELVAPKSVIGKSTIECVRSGVLIGAASMVEGMVERIQDELGAQAKLIGTGGLAPLVLADANVTVKLEPTLTLLGLKIIYERNVDID